MPTLSTPAPAEISGSTPAPAPEFDTAINRRKTRPVSVGDIIIGGTHPVVVQSMINEDTLDIEAVFRFNPIAGEVDGIGSLHGHGSYL